ncbi:MAG: sulfite exporter TauE/SafE family protein [Sphingomonas sp.]|nr:sulfite exporter TauE/SafE family protein [Sphingomonas sp.]MBN8808434.1 sulfite exporter TauE/SafE family protein [Sphingomonas sp.]
MASNLSWAWAELWPFIAIGFIAQLVDGTIGMGFGVLSNTLLIIIGFPPAVASATVRSAEGFASGVSGISHALRRNVDWPLFARLVIPGIIGGFIGAYLILRVHAQVVRPLLFAYLGALGIYLLWRAPRRPHAYRQLRGATPIGIVGALVDTTGGGCGPIVTGSLLAQGGNPRTIIGTVNAAEFFVTITVLSAFIGTIGLASVTSAMAGLLIGGVVAAPVGAILASRLAPRLLMVLVGAFLLASSIYGILALAIGPIPSFPRF